jgi:hypothetical protein
MNSIEETSLITEFASQLKRKGQSRDAVSKTISEFHQRMGYPDAREWTDEEKEKFGFDKNDYCGTLGVFGVDNLPPFMRGSSSK